mmetsp:Transcript_14567/g.23851  ORF Transcript_14567/g.23851 Transcript_14567/m.23851 type:complete len:539 (+) Transcript_14567:77-1693(+)
MTAFCVLPSWRNLPFSLSLLQLLLAEPVAAFALSSYTHQGLLVSSPARILQTSSKAIQSATTRLYASDSKDRGSKLDGPQNASDVSSSSSSNNEAKKQTINNFLPSSSSTGRRRRKLVDRSNVYSIDTSRTTTTPKSLFVEVDEEELCFLDELPGTDVGKSCFVSSIPSMTNNDYDDKETDPSSKPSLSLPFNTRRSPLEIDLLLRYLPIIMPILAYSTYESTARMFDRMVEFISDNNWIAVDGGQYQAEIITPAINGLVVPSLALLFATLVNNTINTLRQRQLQIRTSLNTEANDLRVLVTILDSLPPQLCKAKNHLREYLIQYASRVIAESKPGLSIESHMYIGSMDIELNGFLRTWNAISMGCYGTMYVDTMLPASNYTVDQKEFDPYQQQLSISPKERQTVAPFLSPYIFSETYDTLTRLRKERSMRVSALQSTYPMLHYVILALLASSICTVFLMETNQDLLLFLSAIQLRVLWSMLIGTFSALGVVNYDMIDPFRGSYNVAVSVDQFYTIRAVLMASIEEEEGEEDVKEEQR